MPSFLALRRFPSLLFAFAAWTLAFPVAQANPADFYGFWQVPEPEGDTAVVIIKVGGDCSAFWTSNTSAIRKGTWVMEGEDMVVTWPGGVRERLRSVNKSTILRLAYNDPDPATAVRGVRVDPRVPGSLSVSRPIDDAAPAPAAAPTGESRTSAPGSLDSEWIGFWKVPQDTGSVLRFWGGDRPYPNYFLRLERGGQARVALREGGNAVGKGTWSPTDSGVRISWPSGREDFLSRRADGSFEISSYTDEQARQRGRAALTQKAKQVGADEALSFFQDAEVGYLSVSRLRGLWKTREGDPVYLRVKGWGRAERMEGTNREVVDGDWRLTKDRLILSWRDGRKDVVRVGAMGYLLERFQAGQEITSPPQTSVLVTRIDASEDAPIVQN